MSRCGGTSSQIRVANGREYQLREGCATHGASQPEWATFAGRLSDLGGFELRRGRHALEAVKALRSLLARRTR
jgi:hypothetical protein